MRIGKGTHLYQRKQALSPALTRATFARWCGTGAGASPWHLHFAYIVSKNPWSIYLFVKIYGRSICSETIEVRQPSGVLVFTLGGITPPGGEKCEPGWKTRHPASYSPGTALFFLLALSTVIPTISPSSYLMMRSSSVSSESSAWLGFLQLMYKTSASLS